MECKHPSVPGVSAKVQWIVKVDVCVAAQDALFKVHARVHEAEEGHGGPPTGVTRMLVCHTQAGSLIGK